MAGFHYEIYRPSATQPDWSTSLSCGLNIYIYGAIGALKIAIHATVEPERSHRVTGVHKMPDTWY